MNNNNALTAMTGGITRPQTPQIINLDSGMPLPKRQPVAIVAPSVKVSLSDNVTGEDSKGQILTEKYEESVRELMTNAGAAPESQSQSNVQGHQNDNADQNGIMELAPLKLPTKADVDAFEKLLNNELSMAGVDTSIPVKLKTDENGQVMVTNDHPDKDKIEAMFKDNPELQQGMVKTEIYGTLQKLYQLHQQWMQKIEGGMSEESANNWLINASKSAAGNVEVNLNNGKLSHSFGGNKLAV